MATEETKEELLQNALLQRPLPFSINNILHQVSTGCPNHFSSSEMIASEVSIVYEKNVFRSLKLLFKPYLKTAKIKKAF